MSLTKRFVLPMTTGFYTGNDNATVKETGCQCVEHKGVAYVLVGDCSLYLTAEDLAKLQSQVKQHQRRIDTK